MGKIFYVMGKSAAGKDTIYRCLLERIPQLKTVTLYTTRPKRDLERDGVEYHFVSQERFIEFGREKRLIESRTYQTIHGDWSYFTVDDGQFHLDQENYLMIGTLESYGKMQEYFGRGLLIPIYIRVSDGERIQRALTREKMQKEPHYAEMCRRYLADEVDFRKEKLEERGIGEGFENQDLNTCLEEIVGFIHSEIKA